MMTDGLMEMTDTKLLAWAKAYAVERPADPKPRVKVVGVTTRETVTTWRILAKEEAAGHPVDPRSLMALAEWVETLPEGLDAVGKLSAGWMAWDVLILLERGFITVEAWESEDPERDGGPMRPAIMVTGGGWRAMARDYLANDGSIMTLQSAHTFGHLDGDLPAGLL